MRRASIILLVLVALVGAAVFAVRSNVRAREEQAKVQRVTTLKNTLASTRKAIQAFHKDNGRYPHSLYELVPKYLQRVPTDPMTGATDWRLITEERVEQASDFTTGGAKKSQPVIIDVQSSAPGYSEY